MDLENKIKELKYNRCNNLERRQEGRLPRTGINYRPTGQRGVGRPRTRIFLEQAVQHNP